MPRNAPAIDRFLRSINLAYDADDPSRIIHFRPTTKCTVLLSALLGQQEDRAFLVVAPYGTGKSLTATYLLQLVENRRDASPVLKVLAERLAAVSPELGQFAEHRRKRRCGRSPDRATRHDRRSPTRRTSGPVLALHGYCPNLADSLKQAALESLRRQKLGRRAAALQKLPTNTPEDTIAVLRKLNEISQAAGCDRVVIIWDEFGRHLESLITEGRGHALSEVQLLAEYVARTPDVPTTLGLLLHQGLINYAANAPQTIRNEWTKIEGRFHSIQYVDDSKELYRLIAEVVSERLSSHLPSRLAATRRGARSRATRDSLTKRRATTLARNCRALGLFPDFNQTELADLLHTAAPLEPVTLHLLPRVSARVAQNERTLFSFLHSVDTGVRITPAVLYDYFSGAMRSDTAVGGTHRQWLETESALSKVTGDDQAVATLKTACLLGLGTGGARTRTGRELLLLALKGYTADKSWDAAVHNLLERKLLLHRRHNDEVSVWHGTDLDLRGRLADQRRRLADDFDLVHFLETEAAPLPWKPVQYNDDYCIRRYFDGQYQSVARLQGYLSWDVVIDNLPVDCDGRIVYLIAETEAELQKAAKVAHEQLAHPRLVVVIPREPLPLAAAAIEVTSLGRMQLDAELVESDPLALPEIQQMTDDARDHLQRLVDRLTHPSADGPRWFYQGEELPVQGPRDLRRALSQIMRDVYCKTPRINNEVIVRRKPSPQMINSRKKLLLGILERHGQPELGIEGHFPDKSMFQTVLLHTGIYRQNGRGRWGYAAPRSLEDPGLRDVWRRFQEFLTIPSDTSKQFHTFFEELIAPPFGLRAGLIPILLGAAFKAFPSAISLTRNGEYVVDILPSEVERICKQPDEYRLTVLDVDDKKLAYLRALHKKFSSVGTYEAEENELVRLCFDAIEAWKAQLPPSALTTNRLSQRAQQFRQAITRTDDPVRMIFDRIPAACEATVSKPRALLQRVRKCMDELAGVVAIYAQQAGASLVDAIGMRQLRDADTVREAARTWAECFSDPFVERLNDGIAKGLLARMRMPYDSDELLLNSLASLLVGRALARWDDSTIANFDREAHTVIRRIEDIALATGHESADEAVRVGLKQLVRSRIADLYSQLESLVGADEAQDVLDSITAHRSHESVSAHGDDR